VENQLNIGIITPYTAQVEKIRRRLKKCKKYLKKKFNLKHLKLPTVATVDGFQGLEKDFIILSLVRSKGDSVGFINSFKRLNVAITRAKYGLVILGDVEHIRNNAKN
jgi:superfamily I DNA and/or RNA helicase